MDFHTQGQGSGFPGTSSIHEAAGRIGALPSTIKPLALTMTLAGPALPVRCPPGDNLWIHRAMIEARPGEVLVVDCGGGGEFGYWGEIMATSGITVGLGGLVITGGVRDSLALIELGLPTFCGRVCIQGTGKDPNGDGAVGEPIRIGNVTVRRGDLVVGDADGVMSLCADVADGFVAAARARERKEAEILQRVRAGEPTLDVYNL
ncbi:RraA family protein [Novosphingobium sp. Leaf2]|uniref:RraA family protein n=1 Tax=Novosphingobium sp. Leaf2 TaxID=1735670 RepID=UPI0009EA7A5B|nr:4-hydroxy-4-methyl-2-oxoglutarate aldolase [Novosphingobium sp. Leaf2]